MSYKGSSQSTAGWKLLCLMEFSKRSVFTHVKATAVEYHSWYRLRAEYFSKHLFYARLLCDSLNSNGLFTKGEGSGLHSFLEMLLSIIYCAYNKGIVLLSDALPASGWFHKQSAGVQNLDFWDRRTKWKSPTWSETSSGPELCQATNKGTLLRTQSLITDLPRDPSFHLYQALRGAGRQTEVNTIQAQHCCL